MLLENETKTFTFTSFGFFEISRDSVKYIKEKNLGNNAELILANATPFGIPFDNVFKISMLHNEVYFTILKFNFGTDAGNGLIIKLTKEFLQKYPTSLLVENMEELFNLKPGVDEITIFYKFVKIEEVSKDIPNLDGIIFSLLVGAPLYVLSDSKTIVKYFKRFQDLFPLKVSNKATVVSNSNSFRENVSMIGMEPTPTNLSSLEKIKSLTNSIWYIEKSKVFASFTSNLTKYWAKLIDNDKDQEFKDELLHFCEKIEMNHKLENTQDVVEKLGFSLNDAQLFIGLKGLLSGERRDINKINEW